MPPEAQAPSTDKARWMLALENIAEKLGKEGPPVRLCLIGSAACIFAGMELRTTENLDVWQPSSDFDLAELKAACEAVGISFNPTGLLEPDRPYLRLAEAALVTFVKESENNHDLAMTDPALYRTLRGAVTTFYLRGGGALNLEKLRQLASTVS